MQDTACSRVPPVPEQQHSSRPGVSAAEPLAMHQDYVQAAGETVRGGTSSVVASVATMGGDGAGEKNTAGMKQFTVPDAAGRRAKRVSLEGVPMQTARARRNSPGGCQPPRAGRQGPGSACSSVSRHRGCTRAKALAQAMADLAPGARPAVLGPQRPMGEHALLPSSVPKSHHDTQ